MTTYHFQNPQKNPIIMPSQQPNHPPSVPSDDLPENDRPPPHSALPPKVAGCGFVCAGLEGVGGVGRGRIVRNGFWGAVRRGTGGGEVFDFESMGCAEGDGGFRGRG